MKNTISLAIAVLLFGGMTLRAQVGGCSTPIAVTPTSPFFEDFEGGTMPACWSQNGYGTWQVESYDFYWGIGSWSGNMNARVASTYVDSVTTLYTPWLDISALSDCRLEFMQYRPSNYGYTDSLRVLVRTSATGPWQTLGVYGSANTTWVATSVALPSGADTCQVAFRYKCHRGGNCRLDDIYIGEPLTCGRVIGLAATAIGSDSVALAWRDTANTGATYTVGWWGDYGDTLWATTADTSLRIGGLGGSTLYHFSVVAGCTDGSQSLGTECRLRTAAGTVHIPWCERFEGLGGSYNTIPPGWITLTGTPSITNYANIGYSLNVSGTHAGSIALPPTDQPTGSLQVRFRLGNGYYQTGYHGTFSVGYTTNIMDTAAFVSVASWPNYDCYMDEEKAVLLLGAPDSARIVLRSESVTSYLFWLVDDLVVETIPACTRPMAVNVTGTTSSTISLAIDGLVDSYRIYWANSTATDSADVSDSVYTITGLDANTDYIISVATRCTDGSLTPTVNRRARTLCDTLSIPYAESFSSFPLESAPYCWTVLNGNPYIADYGMFGHSDNLLFMGVDMFSAIALPAFDMPLDTLQVRFWLQPTSGINTDAGVFSVGWQTDLADSSTFVVMDSWSSTEWPSYGTLERTVPMYNAPAGARIVMRASLNIANRYWLIDSLTVEPMPSCPPPTRFEVTGIGYDTIAVSFRGGRTGNYRLYITDGLSYSDTVLVSGTTSHTFTGLDTITAYTIRLVSDCGNEVSDPLMVQATTEMVADTLPYHTGFEPGDDVAWRCLFSNTDNEWCIGSAVAASGSRSLYITDDGGTSNHFNPGVQPNPYFSNSYAYKTFWVDAPADYTISYDWRSRGRLRVMLAPASFEVNTDHGISNLGAPVGWIGLDTNEEMNYSSTWRNYTQIFTVDTPGFYHLIFYWFSGNTPGTQPPAAIDNVRVERISCPAVRDILIDNVTQTSAIISWSPFGTESEWEVSVGDRTMLVSAPTYYATGLSPTTTYNVVVLPVCNAGDTGLAATGWFTTELCERATVIQNYDSTLRSTFFSDTPFGNFMYNYTYAQTIIPASSLDIYNPEIQALAFEVNASNHAVILCNRVDVYMANVRESVLDSGFIHPDANHQFVHVISDGDFSFSENRMYTHSFDTNFIWDGYSNVLVAMLRNTPAVNASNWLPNFTSHYNNSTYAKWNRDISSNSNPIDIYSVTGGYANLGASDIYLISCPDGCDMPTVNDLVADAESATLHFDAQDTVEVVITSDPWSDTLHGSLLLPSLHSHTFSGLYPMTHYTVGIRQLCSDSLFSDWVVLPVTTLDLGCMPPTDLALGSGDYTSQTFSWSAADNEDTWELRVFNAFSNIVQTVNASPATVDGLYVGTAYRASIRSLCGAGSDIPGPWGDTLDFATPDCPMVNGVSVSNIADGSAIVSWHAVTGSTGYRIYYGLADFYDFEATVVDVPAGTTSYEITGLAGGTAYEVYVLNRCADGVFSGLAPEERVPFSTPAGIDDLRTTDSELLIYPNPASGSVTVRWPSARGQWTVEIVDLNGKRISELRTPNSELQINLGRFAPGAYFLRVTDERQTLVRKLIVR